MFDYKHRPKVNFKPGNLILFESNEMKLKNNFCYDMRVRGPSCGERPFPIPYTHRLRTRIAFANLQSMHGLSFTRRKQINPRFIYNRQF